MYFRIHTCMNINWLLYETSPTCFKMHSSFRENGYGYSWLPCLPACLPACLGMGADGGSRVSAGRNSYLSLSSPSLSAAQTAAVAVTVATRRRCLPLSRNVASEVLIGRGFYGTEQSRTSRSLSCLTVPERNTRLNFYRSNQHLHPISCSG